MTGLLAQLSAPTLGPVTAPGMVYLVVGAVGLIMFILAISLTVSDRREKRQLQSAVTDLVGRTTRRLTPRIRADEYTSDDEYRWLDEAWGD